VDGLSTKLGKKRLSTLHTKVPSILSKDKLAWKIDQPPSGLPTKRNGKKKEMHLPLSMQQLQPISQLTQHLLKFKKVIATVTATAILIVIDYCDLL